jgi:sterol desaturase/sphingolipid hydroxylase (fatty acid hydroxylase superfamily)
VRVDIVYTLIHRLGLFRVALFFSIDPLWDAADRQAAPGRAADLVARRLWPGVTDNALVSFVLYLLLFDLVDYALHRAQHRFGWWWQLHAVHHSQRQMTMWSDNRNHLLDDLIRDSVFVLRGAGWWAWRPQFVAIVA